MTVQLKPYPAYKESVAPWIGTVPAHWEVCSNRALFEEINVRRHQTEPLLSVTIARGVVRQADLLTSTSKKDSSNKDKSNYKLVRSGDIVYNKMRAWQGAAGASRFRGLVSPAYIVVRPRRGRPEYFHYLMRTPAFAKEAERWSYGITSDQWSLRPGDFKQIYSPVPPSEEQRAIAAFIERADRGIHRLIRAKRRMIDLLNEQKQAIIHQAVTRGLAAAARLKPTGFAPLREIPSHWQLMRIRHLVTTIDHGVSPQAEAQPTSEGRWGVLKAGCVNGGVFRENQNKRLPPEFSVDPALAVRSGDLLVSRASGSSKLVGSVAIVGPLQSRLILSDKIFRLTPRRAEIADFLAAAMNTRYFRTQIEQAISGAEGLANNLPLSALKDFRIGIPPTDEAIAIASHIRQRTASVDRLLQSTNREIELLREYRTRLIADVVTGKLDVREAELPDVDIEGQEDLEMDEFLENEEEESPAEIEETTEVSA